MRANCAVYRDEDRVKRRDFVRLGWATMIATGAGKLRPAFGESPGLQQAPGPAQHPMAPMEPKAAEGATGHAADFTLQIAPMLVELAPQVVISTIGYSNKVPGPLLRVREGQRVTVDVVNDTDVPEYVHWHGLFVPPEVDGVEEEGTPPVPPHGRRRYQFVAKPAGSRWYHSHTAAMMDLHRGAYTGQFGFFMIDRAWRMTLDTTTRKSFWRCVNGNIFCLRWIRTRWRRIPRPDARKTRQARPAHERTRSQRSSLFD